MSGSELQKQVTELGMSVAAFARIAGISEPTLSKLFADDPSVRETTRAKVVHALRRCQKQLQNELLKPLKDYAPTVLRKRVAVG